MGELVVDLAETLRQKLKFSEGNPSDLLALRTAIQVMRPDLDQLTKSALPILQRHMEEFSGTFLDVGCYGGWVFPYVRGRVDYHGIDIWPTAIEAGTRMWGQMFEQANVTEYEKKHDVVWCSQILFSGIYEAAWEKCKSLANTLCIFVTPDGSQEYKGYSEKYAEGRMTVVVWRS